MLRLCVLLSVFAVSVCFVHSPSLADVRNLSAEVHEAFRRGDYNSVLELIRQDRSLLETSPAAVYAFCGARFSLTAMRCFEDEPAQATASIAYGEALFAIWQTDSVAFAKRDAQLVRLNAKFWRLLVAAEDQFFRKSFVELHPTLEALQRLRTDRATVKLLEAYRVELALQEGEWTIIRRALAGHSVDEVDANPVLAAAQIDLLLNDGASDEAMRRSREISVKHPRVPFAQALAMRTAYELGNSEDVRKIISDVPEEVRNIPEFVLETGLQMLGSDDAAQHAPGRRLVEEALRGMRYRADSTLSTALWLARYHHVSFASQLIYRLNANPSWQGARDSFTDARTLSAWNDVYAGNLPTAKQVVKHALSAAPRDEEANWLLYLICKRESDTACLTMTLSSLSRTSRADARVRDAIDSVVAQLPENKKLTQIQREIKRAFSRESHK